MTISLQTMKNNLPKGKYSLPELSDTIAHNKKFSNTELSVGPLALRWAFPIAFRNFRVRFWVSGVRSWEKNIVGTFSGLARF